MSRAQLAELHAVIIFDMTKLTGGILSILDREDALRDDFHLETTYDYGEEDEWDENEANWNADEEETNEEEALESKDESKAYLEFLNDEVCRDLRATTRQLSMGFDEANARQTGSKVQPSDRGCRRGRIGRRQCPIGVTT